jgi:DNA-binding beta-propeller fold protein YncE
MSSNGHKNGHHDGLPHALLRAGYPYIATLGMRRVTTYPMDVAFGDDGRLFVLCRHDFPDLTHIRIINWEDEDLGTVEGAGRGGANFVWPVCIARGPDGNLYVSDEGTNRISRFDQHSGFVSGWGETGTAPGRLNRPSGFAFDAEGTIWVSDTQNHRVQRFTLEGKHIGGFGEHGSEPGKLNMPWGITFDHAGNVLVVDWRNDRVQRFTPEGKLLSVFGSSGSDPGEFNRPAGIAVDSHGDIYVADRGNNRVQLFDPRERYVDRFLGDATLSKIGRRYILANPKTLRLRDMAKLEVTRPFRSPPSVRIDDEFRMYVADTGAHRVQVYRKEAYPLTEAEIFPEFTSPTLATT